MFDVFNNLANAVTLDASNLANLTLKKSKLAVQIKVSLSQKKLLTDLLSKAICGITETQSENQNANKPQRTDKTRRR